MIIYLCFFLAECLRLARMQVLHDLHNGSGCFFFVAALKKQSHQSSHAGNLPKQYFFCLAWKMEQILEHRKSISIVMEQQILENLGVARSLRKKSIRNPN